MSSPILRSCLLVLLVGTTGCTSRTATVPINASGGNAGDVAAGSEPAAAPSGYDRPPQHILDVLHAPSPPYPHISPTRDTLLMVSWVEYPPIRQVAEPYLGLAGVRVEPRTRRKHDTYAGYGIAPCAQRLELVDVASRRSTEVELPAGCADGMTWAADGKRFAFRNTSDTEVELWVGDASTGKTRRLGTVALNPILGSSVQWLADQKTLLVKLVPENPGPPPARSVAAGGPRIQETDGASGESSTYERRDTLASKRGEDLFEYYATSQLALIDATTGSVRRIGEPAVFSDLDPAPDGEHILVSTIRRPYSYVTTYDNFAHDIQVWNRSGRRVHEVARLPVADRVPIHGVPMGPRGVQWRATEPATLVWAEALDGGDWNVEVPARDKVMMHSAPFTAPATEILRTEQRFSGLAWGAQRDVSLLYEYDHNRHWFRAYVVDVDAAAERRLLWDMSVEERYADPGNPVYRVLPSGQWVLHQEGDAIFLQGDGATPDGDRPFLDRLDLRTGKTERLFRSRPDAYEYFLAFTEDAPRRFLTWHQTPTDPPNAMLRTLGERSPDAAGNGEAVVPSERTAITAIPDPTPAVRAIEKRLVKYQRADGTPLSFTLYTPPGYVEGTRVPAILYAYPVDYASARTAGQITGSEQRFTRLRSYRLLLLAGYAIIDRASFPIVGDPRKAYDTYLEQLVANAEAAVDKAVELGVVDRDRIGVTGHSHGAMMVANLLAHTDLFRAGIATSGAYNKSLTPFGFQNERRSLWKAPEVYIKTSPFFAADRIDEPLLLMHGTEDANPGTRPGQSVELFEAIRGNGGIARLVMLPHEPHSYTAMESNEQLAFEFLRWFDRYVKDASPREAKE